MDSLTWNQSVKRLLAYYGIVRESVPEQGGIKELESLLLGSALSVCPLHAGVSRFGAGIDGALVELENGGWKAFVLYNGQSYALTPEGVRGAVLKDSDLAKIRHGFIVRESNDAKSDIFSFYRRHKGKVAQIMACGFLTNIFGLSLPIFSSFVYDKILGNNIHETLWALTIGLFLMAILDFSIRSLRVLIAERFAIASEGDIDGRVFQGLLNAKAQDLPSIGSFLDRYKRLLGARDILSSSYLLALVDIPFIFLFAFAMFIASGTLVLVPLVFGFLVLFGNLATSIPLYDYDRQSREPEDRKFRILTDSLASHEALVGSLFSREMTSRWCDACARASSLQSLVRYWRNMGMTAAGVLTFLSYAIVIVGGAYMVDAQSLTSGGLLAASMLASRMMAGFSSIVTLATRYKDFKTSLKEMNAILPKPQKSESGYEIKKLKGRINFDNVTCRLKKDASPVLSSISVRINHGEMVGIAGIPGSGKTTFLRLISGVLVPESGEVLIDHFPARLLKVEEMAATVGYKPQDFCLFEGSIEDNVRAGAKPLTDQQREQVLTISGLGWVFQQGGLDWTTQVGPHGSHLSGGQKQLVALARTFLGEKSIFLLDEPTTGLDSPLESHLLKKLASMKSNATVLVTTHNRELLSLCDRIMVIGNARLLADGPREKILVA